jgi:hypothetical protein
MARYASAFSLRLPKLDLGTVRPLRNFSLISKRVDERVKIAGKHLAFAHHEAGAWFRCAPKRALPSLMRKVIVCRVDENSAMAPG